MIKYRITGKTCQGKPFEETCTFELIRPKDSNHYGTGCYMRVKMSLSGPQLEDVRYARTTDLDELACRFIKGWYGDNAEEVTKV